MKKYIIVLLIAGFSAGLLFAEKPVTTVLDFDVNGISSSDMKSIISFLSASIYDTGEYRVIDTAQRDTILKELEFSYSGCTDDSCQLEVGKLLSAEYIITGDIAKVGSRFILSAKMLETETSETAGTAKGIYTTLDELIDDMPAFAISLVGSEAPAEAVSDETVVEDKAAEAAAAEPLLPAAAPEPVPPQQLSGDEIAGWAALGAGAAMIGTGAFFLIDSVVKITAVNEAEAAYLAAASDFTNLYTAYTTAFNAAADSNTFFWVGAGLVGGGIASAVLSIFLFPKEAEAGQSPVTVAIAPGAAAVRLSF